MRNCAYRPAAIVLTLFVMFFGIAHAKTGIGDPLPASIKAIDQNGVEQTFETLVGKQGAVIVFVRSADWCPFCQAQLLDLSERGEEITKYGFSIISISYDSPDKLKAFSKKYSYPYTMLSDEGSELIKQFGILNEDIADDSPYYGIPHPTVYVVNSDGFVQAVLAEEGYKDRPQIEAIVDAIKANQF